MRYGIMPFTIPIENESYRKCLRLKHKLLDSLGIGWAKSNPPFRTIILIPPEFENGPRPRRSAFCNDHFDHTDSRYRLLFSDCSRFAPERKERRLGCGFWRTGQPDGVWPARCSFGSFPRDHLVGNHLHAHVHHAFDFCSTPNRAHLRAFRSEAVADQVAARDSGRAVRSAHRSAEPGATKIKVLGLRSQELLPDHGSSRSTTAPARSCFS